MGDLANFLAQQKAKYLEDVKNGKGKEWTVVMGNEAGDLDSLASAIALAWYRTTIQNIPSISLSQTPTTDLHLRAENLHALHLAGLDPSAPPILCLDELPSHSPFPSHTFALVDHNRLLPLFTHSASSSSDVKVVAIIDHHEDEGQHKTADPRIVKTPVGSASSLVALYIQADKRAKEVMPGELARLLLCAVAVDTDGVKPGGKAEEEDREAVGYLLSRANIAESSGLVGGGGEELHEIPELRELTGTLAAKKGDVSHLTTRDLLRRDYKEYTLVPSSSSASTTTTSSNPSNTQNTILVGLATVPIGLSTWLHRVGADSFWAEAQEFVEERGLSVLGILTSFRDEEHPTKKHKEGKHRREQVWFVRERGSGGEGLAEKLFEGLKGAEILDLKKRRFSADYGVKKPLWASGKEGKEGKEGKKVRVKVWEQGNAHATRKVTAPLVRGIIEGQAKVA
ncbi:hypothetical protein BC629DRAFT_1287604 [Irpex lacteus]|nr:hypothetical protein BC629DRAFT_1287604 [Irpex lacteus]